MKNSQNEKLSEYLLNVDEDILGNAYEIDDAEKLRQYIRTKNAKVKKPIFGTPIFYRVMEIAVCFVLLIGAVALISTLRNSAKNTSEGNNQHSEVIPPWLKDDEQYLNIESIDMLNYYTAIKVLADPSNKNQKISYKADGDISFISASANDIGFTLLSDTDSHIEYDTFPEDYKPNNQNTQEEKIYYYELDPNEAFVVTKVIFFQVELKNEEGFLASKIGTGVADVVITENSLEPMITFKNGDKYYSCCENSIVDNVKLYSTHKYIEGFYIVKNMEQENYSFSVAYDNFNFDYVNSTVSSVICSSYKNGGKNPDGELSVVSETYVSEESVELTVADLEDYFNLSKHPENNGSGTTVIPPASGGDTPPADTDLPQPSINLEFWITENVDSVDFSKFQEKYGMFGGKQYYGTGYVPAIDEDGQQLDPEYCVIYTVTSYPDYSDKEQHITGIYITDPNVEFFGITLNSSFQDFEYYMKKQGFEITVYGENHSTAKKGNVWIAFTQESIRIGVEITNEQGIIF